MAGRSQRRWFDLFIFGLSVFLVFCLLFEGDIVLPAWFAWLGRWHPVVVHFPIVLLLILVFYGITAGRLPRGLFAAGVLFALVTAISGFFLGKEHDPKGDLLFRHQWLGAGVALVSAAWYSLAKAFPGRVFTRVMAVILLILVAFTAHFGGMVTHGEDFLALPGSMEEEPIPENPLIYRDVVARVLKHNCVSCHNPNKRKGELQMTGLQDLLEGGESGKVVVPGKAGESEIIRRLQLPQEDEDHMPPEGKKPLNDTEIQIIERWIALGASDSIRLGQLDKTELLATLVRKMMEPDPRQRWAELPQIADTTINRLSSDYLTVQRLAAGLDALVVNAYRPPEYDPQMILNLRSAAANLVEMDLSGLPVGPREMAVIFECVHLEHLELDATPVTDEDLLSLDKLPELRRLKLYKTAVGDACIPAISNLPKLEELYLWDTNVSGSALAELQVAHPKLRIVTGIEMAADSLAVRDSTGPQ